jgi:hypothetical protein
VRYKSLFARYLKSVENFKENPIREPDKFSSGDDLFVPRDCANASMSGMEKRREELLTLEKKFIKYLQNNSPLERKKTPPHQ